MRVDPPTFRRPPQTLTVAEAAKRLRTPVRRVLKMIHYGPLPAAYCDGELLVAAADLDQVARAWGRS